MRAFLDLNADPLALRKIPVALAASGFEVGPYTVHTVVDEAEDTYCRRADLSPTNRGDAAGVTWILRGDESRRRRGCDADSSSRPARAFSYGYQFIMLRGIDMFADKGIVGQPMIEAMKAEAARRVAAGEFRMVMGYGYVAAQKPSG